MNTARDACTGADIHSATQIVGFPTIIKNDNTRLIGFLYFIRISRQIKNVILFSRHERSPSRLEEVIHGRVGVLLQASYFNGRKESLSRYSRQLDKQWIRPVAIRPE